VLTSRAVSRAPPLAALAAFDADEWELLTAEVREDTGRFVNSAWTREINGRRWWVEIGLEDTIETVIDTDKRGLGESVVTGGELYERVERVNRGLMLADAAWQASAPPPA
jgi:hypothetical protein